MRVAFSAAALVAAMLMLTGCPGYVKGSEVGAGFDAMDTESKESKDNEKWFNSYYGKNHCVWGVSNCSSDGDASSDGGGGGGMSGDGVGHSDSSTGN